MRRLKTRIIIETVALAGILSILFLCLQRKFIALGILLGVFTGMFSFHLLTKYIRTSLSIGLSRIKPYFFLKYLIRYVIMGVVLFFSAKIGLKFFLGTAAGLLLIYLVIVFDSIIMNKKECKIQAK